MRGRNRRAGTPVNSARATPDRTPAYPQSPREDLEPSEAQVPRSYFRSMTPERSPRGKWRFATPDRRRDLPVSTRQETRHGREARRGRHVSSILWGPSSAVPSQGRTVRFEEPGNEDANLHQILKSLMKNRITPQYHLDRNKII